ncbi:hypothetical protein DQ04_11361010 [Trypanosoma grayi]|uniref:hypothetical protein n=1 Tax=Trypanosoma grayi TaxID=71804 RepID=UPI0004F4A513|nr:hypothetical protein DQ04_11361010 [Trypanosoma grayi]KEG06989.1 hypothetical protein DQ04_11361010 [Trypanosoma grayi]
MKRNTVFLVSAVMMMMMVTIVVQATEAKAAAPKETETQTDKAQATEEQGPTEPLTSSSAHLVTLSGTAWGGLVEKNSALLKLALISDIMMQLERKYTIDNNITFVSLSVDDGLEVHFSVDQEVILKGSAAKLQYLWSAEEVTSMLAQGGFPTTLSVYPGPDKAVLISVRVYGAGEQGSECDGICQHVQYLAMGIGASMAFIFVVVVLWMCCHCCSRKEPEGQIIYIREGSKF